jgi:hypothetical protein
VPTAPETWTEVAAAKAHLNLTDTTDDVELLQFVLRAERAIVNRVGHVKLLDDPITEYRRGGTDLIRVNAVPIGVVTAVTVNGATVAEADRDTGAAGWYVDDEDEGGIRAGVIRHTSTFPTGWVKVQVRPGRNPIPEDLEIATLELLRHLWKTQRGNSGRPGVRGESPDGDGTPSGFMLPARVRELIQPYRLPAAG